MPTHRTTIVFVGALIFMCVLGALYVVFVYILHNSQEGLSNMQNDIAVAQGERHALSSLARARTTIESERAELRQYIVGYDDITGFLALIENLGWPHNANVSTAALTVVEGDGLTDELRLSVKASGSYDAVFSVLSLLETLPYKSYVSNVVIERKEIVDQSSKWEGTFSITVAKHKEL